MSEEGASNDQAGMLPLRFEKGGDFLPANNTLQKFMRKIRELKLDSDIQKVIKDLAIFYTNSKDSTKEADYAIIELFTIFNGKKPLKKYLLNLVIKLYIANSIIKRVVEGLLNDIEKDNVCDLGKCSKFFHYVSVLQTSPKYEFEETLRILFPLYMKLFDNYAIYASQIKQDVVPDIEELSVVMNLVLKQILPVFAKEATFLNEIKEQYLQPLLMYSYILLFNDRIGFDLRMKVGLIFVQSFDIFEGETTSISQLISKNSRQFSLSVNHSEDGNTTSNDYLLIIYSSIISVLSEERLISETVDGTPLLYVLLNGILEIARSNPDHSSILVETSRSLHQVTRHLKNVPVDLIKALFLDGLLYVSSHVDHYIDTIRTQSKLIFEELVALAAHHHKNGFTELTDILIEKIVKLGRDNVLKLYAYESIAKNYGCDFLLEKFELLPLILVQNVYNFSVKDQLVKTYQNLVEQSFNATSEESVGEWATTWIQPAINILKIGKENECFCRKVISTAFKKHPAILRMVFPNDYVGTVEESKVLLYCLREARKVGLELDVEQDSTLYWRGLIDKKKMNFFMIHQNEEIRLLVLATVVESLRSTELFLDWEFMFLISYIRYNIASQTPSVRKQMVAYYKKILTRYDAGIKVIHRNIAHLTQCLEMNSTSREHKRYLLLYLNLRKSYRRFIGNITRILVGFLSYDSNYPRRAISLELLLSIYTLLTPEEWKSCWSEDDVKNSHNVLFDTYESNKKMIVKLLKTLPPQYLGFMNLSITMKYMHRSLNLALDVNPNKTLSAAYLFDICSYSPYFREIVDREYGEEAKNVNDATLGMIVILIKKLLSLSADIQVETIGSSKTAVYGLILCIRHLLENRDVQQYNDLYASVLKHLVTICLSISATIMPVVCNPSPEGYLPENVDDICESDESPRAQKVLVYAWRTMKETTLLVAEIVKQSITLENQETILSEDTLLKIGQFFIDIFVQSKHRGVFEQAYVGFSTICECFWKSARPNVVKLPKEWLELALELCTGKKSSEDLCATRRSAGLPFMIISILTSQTDPSYFHKTVLVLFDTAETCTNHETIMHCLNVLRAVFRHSKLGELVGSYVSRGVILAINGLRSDSWGVRNSSTLLFASLITRMFGVQRSADLDQISIKNKLTVNVFFMRYRELYDFILKNLAKECVNEASLILYPILMILSRLYPSAFENEPHKGVEYLPYIDVCLSNPAYRIREAAAKASVALIHEKDIINHFNKCFTKLSNERIADNECHGILLQMYHISSEIANWEIPLSEFLNLSSHIWHNYKRQFSHMTISRYTELVGLFICTVADFEDLFWLNEILLQLSKHVKASVFPYTWQGNFAQTRTVLAYYIILNKLAETDVTYATVTNEVMSVLYGPNTIMKNFHLQFLISLNTMQEFFQNVDNFLPTMTRLLSLTDRSDTPPEEASFEKPVLIKTGDVEILGEIHSLTNSFSRSSVDKLLRHLHPYLKTFLLGELRMAHYIRDEDRVLLFVLLNYYPCVLKVLTLSKQETLNTLLSYCDCDNEELISAVISCLSTYLAQTDYSLLRYDELIKVLSRSASPAVAMHRRLSVCKFLCNNYVLYCDEEQPILNDQELCRVLNMIMVLLEDEDVEVRNAMSNFENSMKVRVKMKDPLNVTIPEHRWSVIPDKAKEDLIYLMTVLLPQEKAVSLIFSWACRYFNDPGVEGQEIFERSGPNQYAENTPLIDICSRVLIRLLWPLPEGLYYEDKSVFIEEQTQVVTTVLLNALTKYDTPMMIARTKMTVICGLKSLYKFVENTEISENFRPNFRAYLNDTLFVYLTKHLEYGDMFSVKKIIKKFYDPVFIPKNLCCGNYH
ncbi:hypothetical protein ABEB36_011593 [Hypothenemus hampei]|uniref:tRNA (32-2'-O)-methyltransferase regulator THADA n=1 Tax=Hypothenemus hampei TaxID=57062 RepID=A0ABD1E987_HYPHA